MNALAQVFSINTAYRTIKLKKEGEIYVGLSTKKFDYLLDSLTECAHAKRKASEEKQAKADEFRLACQAAEARRDAAAAKASANAVKAEPQDEAPQTPESSLLKTESEEDRGPTGKSFCI